MKEKHLSPPEMNSHKAFELGELEREIEDLYGFVDYYEQGTKKDNKFIMELLQEAISEQLPGTTNELLELIEKMGWVDKVNNYMDFFRNQIIEKANENWEP